AYDICACQIDIGNAETPMTQRMKAGVLQPDGSTMIEPVMNVQNVADTIVLMSNMSLDANVQTVTVMASKMPFVGRG
ncbi:MAG: 3-oxoacyl-ACP reductase, partial [Alphaproteobacteria bacterium]